MNVLLQEWLDHAPTLGDESTRIYVREHLRLWPTLPPPEQLKVVRSVKPYKGEMPGAWRDRFASEHRDLKRRWTAMRQEAADMHVTLYTHKDTRVGTVFYGNQNDNIIISKWLICGTEQFCEDFMNIQNDVTKEDFLKKYKAVTAKVPVHELDAFDAQHRDHCYQRVCKFSQPPNDSGWIRIPPSVGTDAASDDEDEE
jgi:hypothetical protein